MLRLKAQASDRRARRSDISLAAHLAPVFKLGDKAHVVQRRRIDASFAREDFGRKAHGFDEIAGHVCECGEKEVAEAVTAQLPGTAKAITKETREQRRVFRERDHAVAYVAGRENL